MSDPGTDRLIPVGEKEHDHLMVTLIRGECDGQTVRPVQILVLSG